MVNIKLYRKYLINTNLQTWYFVVAIFLTDQDIDTVVIVHLCTFPYKEGLKSAILLILLLLLLFYITKILLHSFTLRIRKV